MDAGASPPEDRIGAAVRAVRARIDAAARRAGREPGEVTLVGVTKTRPPGDIAALLDAGVVDLGENRAQELVAKAEGFATDPRPRWHMIGQCQTNKVGALAPHVALWHSVDREPLVDALARRAPGAAVLVQVDLSGTPGRGGCAPEATPALVERARAAALEVRGLMAVAPLDADPRPGFERVVALAAALGLAEVSIGMTDDFEVAIETGATIVRVGRALFGERPLPA